VLVSPAKLPNDRGIAAGRVRVFKGESEVTSACYLSFDDGAELKASYSIDKTGWVFAALPRKKMYLYFVSCAVWNGLSFGTRQIHFEVPGDGSAAYFGDIEFHLANNDLKTTFEVIGDAPAVGGLVGAAAAGTGAALRSGENWVLINDKSAQTAKAYEARFHEKARFKPWPAKEEGNLE